MKRGVAGVRLCDQSGCYDRWPCARHGTLAYCSCSSCPPLPRVAIVPRDGHREPGVCVCGYLVCSCPPKAPRGPLQRLDDWEPVMQKWLGEVKTLLDEALPAEPQKGVIPLAGWDYRDTEDPNGYYRNPLMPHGYNVVAKHELGWACLNGDNYWQHPLEAMLDAEDLARRAQYEPLEYYAADEEPPVRPGWRRMGLIYTYEEHPEIQVIWLERDDGERRWRLLAPEIWADFPDLDNALGQGELIASGAAWPGVPNG